MICIYIYTYTHNYIYIYTHVILYIYIYQYVYVRDHDNVWIDLWWFNASVLFPPLLWPFSSLAASSPAPAPASTCAVGVFDSSHQTYGSLWKKMGPEIMVHQFISCMYIRLYTYIILYHIYFHMYSHIFINSHIMSHIWYNICDITYMI